MSVRINISPNTISLTPDSPNRISLTVLKSDSTMTAFLVQLDRVFYGLGILAIVGGGCLVFLISDTFTVPLGKLVEGVRALEAGNFEYELKPAGGDEVAQVTRAFDRMRSTLKANAVEKAIARRSTSAIAKNGSDSDGSPAESLTISTTCSPLSKATATCWRTRQVLPRRSSGVCAQISNATSRAAGLTKTIARL